jgi:ABC-2 type transport system ATP-binding protein
MEVVFQDFIGQAKPAGRTVLLSSHILAQVEKLCDRISIIRRGVVVQTGSLVELRHLTRTTVEADTHRPVTDALADLPGVYDVEVRGQRVRFAVDSEHLDAAIKTLGGFGISSLVSQPPTLEELMLRHYDELASPDSGLDGDDLWADGVGASR